MEYYSDIFTKDTVKTLCRHLLIIADAITKDPYIQLADVELLEKESMELSTAQFAGASDKPFIEYFEEQALQWPGRIALTLGNEQLSYKQLGPLLPRLRLEAPNAQQASNNKANRPLQKLI